MKKTLTTLLFVAVAAFGALNAQVSEGDKLMSQGNKNGLSLDLPRTTVKFAENLWEKYMKQFKGKTKKDKKAEEWFTDNALIAGLGGANTVDLYAKFVQTGDNVTLTLWTDLGGAYINSKDFPDKYAEAEKILLTYGISVARENTKELLETEQKNLKKLNNNLESLEKDNKGLHKDIDNWNAKIVKAKQEIETNLKNQEESKKKIEEQKRLLEEIQKKLDSLR